MAGRIKYTGPTGKNGGDLGVFDELGAGDDIGVGALDHHRGILRAVQVLVPVYQALYDPGRFKVDEDRQVIRRVGTRQNADDPHLERIDAGEIEHRLVPLRAKPFDEDLLDRAVDLDRQGEILRSEILRSVICCRERSSSVSIANTFGGCVSERFSTPRVVRWTSIPCSAR